MKDYFILLTDPQNIDMIKDKLLKKYGIDIMQILKKKDKSILFDSKFIDNLFSLCQIQVMSYENNLSNPELNFDFHLKQHCIIATLYNIEYLMNSGECHIKKYLFHERFPNTTTSIYSKHAEIYSYDNTIVAKSYANAINYFCNKNYDTFTGNFLGFSNILQKTSKKTIVCPHYSAPFVSYVFKLKYNSNINYSVEYTPYKTTNPTYSTGNKNRAIKNYLKHLDLMNNKLIDYSSIDDDITKILYFYKIERAYGFQLLEEFIKYTNYNRTIETLIEHLSKSIDKEYYPSDNVYTAKFWNILSRFPNCFSYIEWLPFLKELALEELTVIADYSFPLYEITFTITLLEYCNRNLETAREILKSYINDKLYSSWSNVTNILEKKKLDYRMTKFNSKNELFPSSKKHLHISNAHNQNINILKLIENGKIFVNLDKQKEESSSVIDYYLSDRYSKKWWETLPSSTQDW